MLLSPYAGVINAYVILAGQKPGSTSYNEHKAFIDAQGQTAYIAALNSAFSGVSNAAMGGLLLQNTGLTGAFTAAEAESYLAANQGNRVQAVLDLAASLSSYAGDNALILAAKTSFVATVANAYAYASVAGNTSDAASSATSVSTGTSFNLTSAVDSISGGDADDTISGILGTSGTYTVADDVVGGAGDDTLKLITNGSAIAGGLVSLDSVENINVRVLASAGEAVTLNAADWSGVEVLSNASSLSSTVLTVTGIEMATDVKLFGETTINVGYGNTTTAADAVNVILSDAGSIVKGSNFASGSAATVNVDANGAGLISSVSVNLEGTTNLANLEGGANVKTYTIAGDAAGILNTNDTITSFNAAATTGGIDMTFSAASDVAAVGGSGDDTFRFGANFNNADSMDGGAGDDTFVGTVGSFTRNLNTTNVENATITFTENGGGTLNASGSTVASYTIVAGTANAISMSQLGEGTTITLNDDHVAGLTLDYASGVASTTLNIGSASGSVDIQALTVTDVASVTINAVGSGGAFVSGAVSFDADLDSLAITTTGKANMEFAQSGAVTLGGATEVTITSGGSGYIDFGSGVAGTGLTILNINANDSESADVEVGALTASGATSINLAAAGGADATLGASVLGAGGSAAEKDIVMTLAVNGASSDVTVGAITVSGQGTLTINLAQSATADIAVGAITLDKTGTADAAAQNLTVGATTVIAGASAGIASVALSAAGTGAQVSFGAITLENGAQFSAGAMDASTATDVDISAVTVTLGGSAEFALGAVTTTAGVAGDVTVVLGANASADFGALIASGAGSYSIDSTGATGFADFGNITLSKSMGSIEVAGGADNSDVTFGTIAATAVGAISVAGAGDVTIGKITSVSVGSIESTQGVSGNFTINLSGVTNAVEVSLGAATNQVISGAGNDVITLTAGTTGNDTIVYQTATQGNDLISNFGGGAEATAGGADIIAFNGSAMGLDDGLAGAVVSGDTVGLLMFTGASATMLSGTNVILMTTAFASTAAAITQLAGINWATAIGSGGYDVMVVWGNGDDSYVSIAHVTASATGDTTWASGTVTLADTTLATIEGVSAGQLVAANFSNLDL